MDERATKRKKRRQWVRNFKPGESITITYGGKSRGRVVVTIPADAPITIDKPPPGGKNA